MDPSDTENGSLDLSDAIAQSLSEEGGNKNAGNGADLGAALPPEPAWEAPAWTQRWKPEARDALGRFAGMQTEKAHFDALLRQMEDTNGYITRRDQEYAAYRRQLDPVYSVLRPYEQRYALQGMSLHQGVQQLMQAADLLAQSPDQAFPWLGSSYRPQNPGQALQALAQAWGVDLGQAASDAPYVDPAVFALQQQLQQVKSMVHQQHLGAVQQQQHALVQEISDFEAAQDENGQPLHPHFAAVFDDMVTLVQMGRAKDLPSAYKYACAMNPELQQQQQAQAAEAARKKAMEAAAARSAAAEKSEKASRNVAGKSRAKEPKSNLSTREAYEKAVADLAG